MFRKTKAGPSGKKTNGDDKKSKGETTGASLSLGNGEHVPGNDFQDKFNCCPDETLIYAAPTVDTLGDEESLSRLYHSPRQADESANRENEAKHQHLNNNSTSVDQSNDPKIPPNTTPLMREDSVMLPSLSGSRSENNGNTTGDVRIPTRKLQTTSSGDSIGSNYRTKSRSSRRRKRNLIQQQRDLEHERRRQQRQQLQKLNQRRRRRLASKAPSHREFQLDDDKMTVMVHRIPVAERTAFDKKLPPYLLGFGSEGIHAGSSSSGNLGSGPPAGFSKKFSPSWQHWCVLQQMSSVKHVRQLAFSNSVGPAVDIFWREEEDDDDNGDQDHDDTPKSESGRTKKRKSRRRDGRYRSIDPVKATMAALPKAPPLLSNKKHRLPMRTDVGFPRASMEEITQKQSEIRMETEWEEASPRLVVLVTGDDLGTAVQEENEDEHTTGTESAKRPKRRAIKQGLPGMPWAGKNLVEAKERNNRHFSRRQNQFPLSSASSSSRSEGAEKATHMLAPPLDAIYSGTMGWRPRPFHDRPPGLRYTLVCPISVDFSVGKMEPLVCSLALYSLQKGKISEEFYFPAGDWEGKLKLDTLRERSQMPGNKNTDDMIDVGGSQEETDALMQLWSKRKHKAIFAHNSWAFGEEEKADDDNKLYVVLQVYKVTHVDSATAYWAKGNMNNANQAYRKSDKNTWKKKLKKQFSKNSGKLKSTGKDADIIDADETDVEKMLFRSNAMFDAYGTQFTSPLCFGITSLFPEDPDPSSRQNTWPRGQVQQGMELYLSPKNSESQDEFLKRLRKVVSSTTHSKASAVSDPSMVSNEGNESTIVDEEKSVTSAAPSVISSASTLLSPPKKNRISRMIRTPNRLTKRDAATSVSRSIDDTPMIPGTVTLFSSNLDYDFLQSMLITPPELIDKVSIVMPSSSSKNGTDSQQPREVVLPRILVDASGDSAIMVDPKKAISSTKRSDLVRLPSIRLAEHLDSSEFREVLFLSTEPEKIFEPSDYKSLLNLLYIYPKFLVLKTNENESSSNKNKQHHRYTIRVRLVQNISSSTADGIIENRNEIHTSFHNPASWGGSTLLDTVFTHIPRDSDDALSGSSKHRRQEIHDTLAGIPLRDEFKMKLPTILDGTYFLQFSLFAVELRDFTDESQATVSHDSTSSGSSAEEECGIILTQVAETSIPLSSSSIRDPKLGVKATTVIPNGCHRLKLGNFQLQVETKLVSSMHVSDPVVAAALREFPLASSDGQLGFRGNAEVFDEMAISSRLSTIGRSVASRGAENVPIKLSYPKLLGSASRTALVNHFHSLFFLHLCNLTKTSSSGAKDIVTSEKFIVDNMQSLLVLFQRVKSYFLSHGRDFDRLRLSVFVKATIDSFDELSYNSNAKGYDNGDDAVSEHQDPNLRSVELEIVDEEEEENFDGGAIRRRKSDIGIRLTRTYSTMESVPEMKFSRVAYGASKGELGNNMGRITTLFDDDETVASLLTLRSARNSNLESQQQQLVDTGKSYTFDSESNKTDQKETGNNGSVSASTISLPGGDKPRDAKEIDIAAIQQSIAELNIGKRVKSAAQVMLTPCVAVTPGLAALLCKTSPRNATAPVESSESKEEPYPALSDTKSADEEENLLQITIPGSDLDDDIIEVKKGVDLLLSPYITPNGIYRGTRNSIVQLQFSVKQYGYVNGRKAPLSRGSFVYESIMMLWLQAWSDYITNLGKNSAQNNSEISINFLGKAQEGNKFAMFYLQIDILLPMLLKSIVLRYGQAMKKSKRKVARCILDNDHVYVFESFVEMLAVSLMGQAMTELQESSDYGTLFDAIETSDTIVDFFIGLFAVLHPAHMDSLICKFFMTLRKCETEKAPLNWNETTIHRTKCSRQLRLRVIEKLAVLPNFVALNFPQRYSTKHFSQQTKKSTWLKQFELGTSSAGSSKSPRRKGNPSSEGLLPQSGWLASLLTNESLSICALSCEAVLSEAIANINPEKTPQRPSKSVQPSLKRCDVLMFQSIAVHAISCVYELLLRRHAMDRRFQKESSRGRIAALFIEPIFEKSLASVRWLARMESTHRVRSIWMLCFVYILQEAPENLIREHIRLCCDPSDLKIHRFIRLLRLGSATFQSFIDQQRHCMFPLEINSEISPWLLQESFNTVCATTILVVEESVTPTSTIPNEQRKMIEGILDLLLHVLTTPQSTVTHLRAVGGTIQAFERFGSQMFLDTTGAHFQHWIRVTVGLMNSTALSVRSIAVDFVVSLLTGVYDLKGNIEGVALIFATVLPEVVAREIALCSVNGLLKSFEDAEKSIWPLRRSFADIEDANPLDDDRVHPQLAPLLSVFCRTSQAIIDGVLVEMRLRGKDCVVVGTRIPPKNKDKYIFDADEESLFEASNFFAPETAPMQRLRWLLTLRKLHESKENWVEAAETLILCARTISDAIPHLNKVWRPNRFSLWSDNRRSIWLSTVGDEIGNPEQGNLQVMTFANSFLEPEGLVKTDEQPEDLNLPRLTLPHMASLLMSLSKEAVAMYGREGGLDAIAYTQLEALLRIVMDVLDYHEIASSDKIMTGEDPAAARKQYVEEVTWLRNVIASITENMTKLAERVLVPYDETESPSEDRPKYVRVLLSGKKPRRFEESTSLPTFIEWDKPCICRVPKTILQEDLSEAAICNAYGKTIRDALLQDMAASELVFGTRTTLPSEEEDDETKTYIDIDMVRAEYTMGSTTITNMTGLRQEGAGHNCRRFFYTKRPVDGPEVPGSATDVQMTVAISFPCPLSRQRSMLTDESVPSSPTKETIGHEA